MSGFYCVAAVGVVTEFGTTLDSVLLGFTGFYWVLSSFTGFYWVLLGFIWFYRALVCSNRLYWFFYWVLLGFIGLTGFKWPF